MAVIQLLAACGKSEHHQSFEGRWKRKEPSIYREENLTSIADAVQNHMNGCFVINGDRICLAHDLAYNMLDRDICTFEVKDDKRIVHDLGAKEFMTIGGFEADFRLEGNKMTLNQSNTALMLEKQ